MNPRRLVSLTGVFLFAVFPIAIAGNPPSEDAVVTSAGIHGTYELIDVDPEGNQTPEPPQDLTSWTFNALVANSSGGYTVYPGTGSANGTFTIPNVPLGVSGPSYWLEYACSTCTVEYDQVVTRSPILGHFVAVPRGNLIYPKKGVTVDFNMDNFPCRIYGEASSWTGVSWWVPNTAFETDTGGSISNGNQWPCLGPGTLTSSISWTGPLMNAGEGDAGYLLALEFTDDPDPDEDAWQQVYVAASLGPDALTMTDGTTINISGGVSAGDAGRPYVNYDAFAELAPSNASWVGSECTGTPQVLGAQYGYLFPGPEYSYYEAFMTGNPKIYAGCGDVAPSNPFPSASMPVAFEFQSSWVSTSGTVSNWASTSESGPLGPWVGPIVNPQIDGVPFNRGGSSSATPLISWTAPSVGKANLYLLYFYRSGNSSCYSNGPLLFTTTGTQIRIPVGLITLACPSYNVEVESLYDAAGCAGSGDTKLCELSLQQGGDPTPSATFTLAFGASPGPATQRADTVHGNFVSGVAYQLQRRQQRHENLMQRMEKMKHLRAEAR